MVIYVFLSLAKAEPIGAADSAQRPEAGKMGGSTAMQKQVHFPAPDALLSQKGSSSGSSWLLQALATPPIRVSIGRSQCAAVPSLDQRVQAQGANCAAHPDACPGLLGRLSPCSRGSRHALWRRSLAMTNSLPC